MLLEHLSSLLCMEGLMLAPNNLLLISQVPHHTRLTANIKVLRPPSQPSATTIKQNTWSTIAHSNIPHRLSTSMNSVSSWAGAANTQTTSGGKLTLQRFVIVYIIYSTCKRRVAPPRSPRVRRGPVRHNVPRIRGLGSDLTIIMRQQR